MLKIPELAMPRIRKVTTVCNGKCEVLEDREEAKDFFIRQMITTEGEERDQQSAFTFSLCTGLTNVRTRTNKQKSELPI